jgi:predicted PurR-regulated permease PerM
MQRLRRLGEVCLWVLVIGVSLVAALHVASALRLLVLPVLLALVAATFLAPPVAWLRRHGWPAGLAAATMVGVTLCTLAAVGLLLVPAFVDELGSLDVGLADSVEQVRAWLRDAPLPLSSEQVDEAIATLERQARDSVQTLGAQVLSGAVVAVEVVAGLALSVVVLFFFLKDGAGIWAWTISFCPRERRADVDAMGTRVWAALGGFLRAQTLVALFDAVLIGIALVVIGVPLAFPLAVLTFFGAYIPVLGATITGLLAVLLALVSDGVVSAAVVLGAVVAVQQLEGNVFQPVVVGRAVDVHPLAVLLGVTAGGVLAGVIGAMVAAPAVAAAGAIVGHLRDDAA